MVFEGLRGPLYPLIGLSTSQESVRTNFGQKPFVFDIEAYMLQQRDTMWAQIQATPVGWTTVADSTIQVAVAGDPQAVTKSSNGTTQAAPETAPPTINRNINGPISELILDYLIHSGYSRAAVAFKDQNIQEADRASCEASLKPIAAASVDHSISAPLTIPVSDPEGFATPVASSSMQNANGYITDTRLRQEIITAVHGGDIDTALSLTQKHHSSVLEADGGMMLFKLRCRKFIELTLVAGREAVREREENEAAATTPKATHSHHRMDLGDAMDVDEVAPTHPLKAKIAAAAAKPPPPSIATIATDRALEYGRSLHEDYRGDERTAVQSLFKRTFGLLAYHNPLEQEGDVGELAGQNARDELAALLNRSILGTSAPFSV